MTEALLFVGDMIMIGAVVGAIVFAGSYSGFFNWRKTDAGRALIYFVWSLIAVFLNNTAARLLGTDYPFREWVRIVVYLCVFLTTWRLVWVLWRNWRAGEEPLALESKTRKGTIMSNLNPADYFNGQPIRALAVGETVSSSSPKVSLGKSKAVFAAIAGLAVAVGPVLTLALQDGAIDLNEGIGIAIAALVGLGVPGVGTYITPTSVTGRKR